MQITIFEDVILCCVSESTNILGRLAASTFKVEAQAMQKKNTLGFRRPGFIRI